MRIFETVESALVACRGVCLINWGENQLEKMPIDSNDLNWWCGEGGFTLRHGRRPQAIVRVVQDSIYPNMWRVKFADGTLFDMVNLTRAKDAGFTHALGLLNQKTITRSASGRPLKRFSGHSAITLPEREAA
jgi:hypothetical protein